MAYHVLRFFAGSDVGGRRTVNEDAAYAGPRLLAVADGLSGRPGGDIASAAAVRTLAALPFTTAPIRPGDAPSGPSDAASAGAAGPACDPASALASGVAEIASRLDELGRNDTRPAGTGTTLTAMAWDGSGFEVAHIGDSRAYLLRAGELVQLTRDHVLVRSGADGGGLSGNESDTAARPEAAAEETASVRALQSGGDAKADLFRHDAEPGDRYLLCSDGVSDHVAPEQIRETLVRAATPAEAVFRLIDLAADAGGHGDATCVVADVVAATREVPTEPLFVGAARGGGLRGRLAGLTRLGRRPRRRHRRPAALAR
ncbi:MAG TPA: PP2C family serine/threonine-protein phosphatase [Spirillospora sp.]